MRSRKKGGWIGTDHGAYVYQGAVGFLFIQDNGKGIPPAIQTDIFNPFFTTKPVGLGTGLGLSISYDIIVNKHHGDISFNSIAGEGTTFIIRLPIYKA